MTPQSFPVPSIQQRIKSHQDVLLPGEIGDLAAAAGGADNIDLTWTDPSGACSIEIEQSADGESGWASAGDAVLGDEGDNIGSLASETEFFFRVRGVNVAGNGPWSNVDSATTTA